MSVDSGINTIKLEVKGLIYINDNGFILYCKNIDNEDIISLEISSKDVTNNFNEICVECFLKINRVDSFDNIHNIHKCLSKQIIELKVDRDFKIIYEKIDEDDGPYIVNQIFEISFWGSDPYKPDGHFWINTELFEQI